MITMLALLYLQIFLIFCLQSTLRHIRFMDVDDDENGGSMVGISPKSGIFSTPPLVEDSPKQNIFSTPRSTPRVIIGCYALLGDVIWNRNANNNANFLKISLCI